MTDLYSPLVPQQQTPGFPKKSRVLRLGILAALLREEYTHDAHFVQYVVPEDMPYRVNGDVFKAHPGVSFAMHYIVFDFDFPEKKTATADALDLWWAETKPKLQALGTLFWRTKGGARCVFRLPEGTFIGSTDDANLWKKTYLARVVYLEREFGLVADEACCDWNRLQRVPWGRREGEESTVRREVCGELGWVLWEPSEADRADAKKRFWRAFKDKAPKVPKADMVPLSVPTRERAGSVGNGAWFAYLDSRGAIKADLGAGKWAVVCPNEGAHTSESETGTVLYAPEDGGVTGYLHCSHAHCQNVDLAGMVDLRPFMPAKEDSPIDGGIDAIADSVEFEWHALTMAKGGDVAGIGSNVAEVLTKHPDWRGRVAYDTFLQRRTLDGKLWTSTDTTDLQGWLAKERLHASLQNIEAGVELAASRNASDSYTDWAKGLEGKWDGVSRLDTWAIMCFGVEDTPLNRGISARFLMAAVARALKPGCVADFILVLWGEQEVGKGRCLDVLFGEGNVVVPDARLKVGSKDFNQCAVDARCLHDDESVCIRKTDIETVKAFATQRVAKFRKAHAQDFIEAPRRFVMVASTNDGDLLSDEENRRFWPLLVSKLDHIRLATMVPQLWAEAYARHVAGEDHRITKADPLWAALERSHVQMQDTSFVDQVDTAIRHAFSNGLDRSGFTMGALMLAMGFQAMQCGDRALKRRVGAALRALGYKQVPVKRGGEVVRRWRGLHAVSTPSE